MNHNLSNEELRAQMDEEARAAEAAAALDEDDGAPLPAHVKVSRPNRPKVLQVRLSDAEFEALEAIAARREQPVSTVAREQLLVLVDQEEAAATGRSVEWTVKVALNELADLAISIRDAAASGEQLPLGSKLLVGSTLIRPGADTAGRG